MAETITIDALTREISIPTSERAFGVVGEHYVTRKHIRIKGRMVDGNDLAVFAWRVCTENAAKQPNADLIDSVIADSDGVEFDWLIGPGALTYKGDTKFTVCAKQVDGEGKILHEWHSKIGVGTVSDGIDATPEEIGGFDLAAYIQQMATEVKQNATDAATSASSSATSAAHSTQSATGAANSAAAAGRYASAAKKSADDAAAAAKTAGEAATKVINEGVAEKLQQMQDIQTDVAEKQQATNTAAATATQARDDAQAAQKASADSATAAETAQQTAADLAAQAKASADTAAGYAGAATFAIGYDSDGMLTLFMNA